MTVTPRQEVGVLPHSPRGWSLSEPPGQRACRDREKSSPLTCLPFLREPSPATGAVAAVRWGGGGSTYAMHGRSRATIYPCIPPMPGRSTSHFHRPGNHCLHQAQRVVRWSASCMKGELHPAKKPLVRRTFLHTDDSVE